MLPLGQVNHLAFGPGKAMVIGRNTADPARWKRYRGGTAGHLWIDATGSGTFRRMTELTGNITSPMWIGERVYFLSDSEGVGNLYSVKPDGSGLTRHTDHDDFYARHAQTDGKRIVYQCGADIYLFDPAIGSTSKVPIRVPAHRTQAARKFVAAGEYLGGFDVHPAGHSLALDVRGKLFTMGLWEGAVRQLGLAGRRAPSSFAMARRRHDRRGGERRNGRRARADLERRRHPHRCRGTSAARSRCAPRPRARWSPSATIATK